MLNTGETAHSAEGDIQNSEFRIHGVFAENTKHFLFVGTFGLRPKGTLSRRALPLAQALARQGHTVTLLAPPWDWPADAGRCAEIGGVEVVQVRVNGGPLTILARLLLAIWRRRPTVVVACKPKGYSGLVLWFLWWQRRLGGWRGPLWLDADDWEAGWNERLAYPRLLALLFAWQEPWCLAHADRVMAASRWLAAYAAAMRRADNQATHLPNGVERASISPGGAFVRSAPPTALLYTRFVEITPARIVRVWAQVVRQLPSARLIVIGDAAPAGEGASAIEIAPGERTAGRPRRRPPRLLEPSPAAELRARAAAAGLAPSIVVLGWTPTAALPGVLAAADVAWAPLADTAINRARCPVKLVELLAAGLPVVADDVGEASTYITSGVNGLLVAPGSDTLTSQALCRLLINRPLARTLGVAAAHQIAGEFLWDTLVERV
jgi:glycosyltransferase involved in cell wall biosynthesis